MSFMWLGLNQAQNIAVVISRPGFGVEERHSGMYVLRGVSRAV